MPKRKHALSSGDFIPVGLSFNASEDTDLIPMVQTDSRKQRVDSHVEYNRARHEKHTTEDCAFAASQLQKRAPQICPNGNAHHTFRRTGGAAGGPQVGIVSLMQTAEHGTRIPIRSIHESISVSHCQSISISDPNARMVNNYSAATFAFAQQNLAELIGSVVSESSTMRFTPFQRLAAALVVTPLSFDVNVRVSELSGADTEEAPGKWEDVSRVKMRKRTFPTLRVVNYPPGCGKTAISLISIVSLLCDDKRWAEMVGVHKHRCKTSMFQQQSGVFSSLLMDKLESPKIARLALIIVPDNLIEQWRSQLEDLKIIIKGVYQKKIVVWSDTKKRATKEMRSMKVAYDSDKCHFWIVSERERGRFADRECHDYDYGIRVYDEMTHSKGTEWKSEDLSTPILTLCVNATVDQIGRASQLSNHPIRDYFGGEYQPMNKGPISKRAAMCGSLMHVAAPPEWMLSMVPRDVHRLMSPGMHFHRLTMCKDTLQSKMCEGVALVQLTMKDVFETRLSDICKSDPLLEKKEEVLDFVSGITVATPTLVRMLGSWVQDHTNPKVSMKEWIDNNIPPDSRNYDKKRTAAVGGLEQLVERVKAFTSMAKLLVDETEEVEDAITLENIEIHDRVAMSCCGHVVSKTSLQEGARFANGNKCVHCRAPFSGSGMAVGDATGGESIVSNNECFERHFKGITAETLDAKLNELELGLGPTPSINDKIGACMHLFHETVSEPPGALQGIAAAICLAMVVKKSLRALVIAKIPSNVKFTKSISDRMTEKFKSELPSGVDVGVIEGTSTTVDVCSNYKNVCEVSRAQVLFLCMRGDNPASVAGLDLPMTDVTFIENGGLGASDALVQAAGRCLRIEKKAPNRMWKHVVAVN